MVAWLETLSFEAGTVHTVWEQLLLPEYPYGQSSVRTAYMFSPKNWRDTWGFNVASEYKALDYNLRGGYVLKPAR